MTAEIAELRFRSGLPGFPGERRFALRRWVTGPAAVDSARGVDADGAAGLHDGPFLVLVDLDDDDIRFLVAPPAVFFPQYVVEIDDATVEALRVESAEEVLVLVIVTLGDRPEAATANLLGPVVVNTRTREGMQAVLTDSGYGTRVPLVSPLRAA